MRLGAIEAGGTKFVLGVGDEFGHIFERKRIETRTPEVTLGETIEFFKDKEVEAIGIGTFGPVRLDVHAFDYGHILRTPKPGWAGVDIVRPFTDGLGVPVKLDTDVNASCLGEVTYGSSKGLDPVVYLTVGTGVGAGIFVNGALVHGDLHPEVGHMILPVSPDEPVDSPSCCPRHDNCLEGLACGVSVEHRWGRKGEELYENKAVWELEAHYLSVFCANMICVISPKRLILGGGIMEVEGLFPMIRDNTDRLLNGYLGDVDRKRLETLITGTSLRGDEGLMGALKLAAEAGH